jgi:hypothetical protein
MSVTDGCNKDTRAVQLNDAQLIQIEMGLELQIQELERLAEAYPEDDTWSESLDVARKALDIVREA